MKKFVYYLFFILLLFLISIMPTSAKEIKTCVRTESDPKVRDKFIRSDNLSDILSTPCVDEVDKIYDFADLLKEEEEDLLYDLVMNFKEKTNYELVLVTTNENPKQEASRYADDFYDYNYFGENETRDGLLILIDMATRELYISTTGYAIKMYDDYRIERILDAGYDFITDEKYYDTFSSMIKSTDSYYDIGYPESNENLLIDEFGNPYYEKHIPYVMVLVISSLITLIVSLIMYFQSVLKIKVGSTISYLKKKDIFVRKDDLVNTVVTHTLRASDSSSSGSSHGGGSSFHSSSSGSSHGGGGRHF